MSELTVGASTFEEIVEGIGKPKCASRTCTSDMSAAYMADWSHCNCESGPWPICEECSHQIKGCFRGEHTGYYSILCQL